MNVLTVKYKAGFVFNTDANTATSTTSWVCCHRVESFNIFYITRVVLILQPLLMAFSYWLPFCWLLMDTLVARLLKIIKGAEFELWRWCFWILLIAVWLRRAIWRFGLVLTQTKSAVKIKEKLCIQIYVFKRLYFVLCRQLEVFFVTLLQFLQLWCSKS